MSLMRRIPFSFLLIVTFLGVLNTHSQTNHGSVKGDVKIRWRIGTTKDFARDDNGRIIETPVPDANIWFTGPVTTTAALTGQDGTFSAPSLMVGDWTLEPLTPPPDGTVESANQLTIKVRADSPRHVEIRLIKPDSERTSGAYKKPKVNLVFYQLAGFSETAGKRPKKETGVLRGNFDEERKVVGTVLNTSKQPVASAVIKMLGLESKKSREHVLLDQTLTNHEGKYSLKTSPSVKFEGYVLVINHVRYYPSAKYFGWKDNPPADLIINPVTLADESTEMTLLSFEPARRTVFLPELMQTLPVPGLRSFDYFALLGPGVLPPPETVGGNGPGVSPGVGTGGQFAVNGLRSRENNFTMDGSDNNDEDIGTRRQGFVLLSPQPIETLQEFQIITALADARFGRNVGGQVNALTQSGSSGVHGELYGFFTHDRFNARNYFDQTRNQGPITLTRSVDDLPVLLDGNHLVVPNLTGGKEKFERAQAGLVIGSEVKLLKRLRSFFFSSYELIAIRANKEAHFAVPTVAQRGLFNTGETGLFLRDLPPSQDRRIFPTTIPGAAIFSLYPFPNNPQGPYGQNTYSATLPADANGRRFSFKVDHQVGNYDPKQRFRFRRLFEITDGDTVTGRYNLTMERSVLPVTGDAMFSSMRPRVRTQNVAFFINRTLTSNVTDTIRLSVGRTRLTFDEVRDASLLPSTLFPNTPFLLNAPLLLNNTQQNTNGTLTQTSYVSASSVQGATLLSPLGYGPVRTAEEIAGPLGQVVIPGFSPLGVDANYFPQSRANNTFQVADTIVYVHNRNIYSFGFDIRRTQINSTQDRGFRPAAVFNGLHSFRPLSPGLTVAGPGSEAIPTLTFSPSTMVAAGVPTGLFQTLAVVPDSSIGLRYAQFNFFLQEERRVRPNLSLTFGLRYELNTVPESVGQRLERALDPDELAAKLNQALTGCETNLSPALCENIIGTIRSAFPADFKLSYGTDKNDLDVRLGFAWDPNRKGKTVLRGGFGTFSGQFNGIVLGQSRNAFPNFLPLNLAGSPFFPPGGAGRRTFFFNPANPALVLADGREFFAVRPGTLNTLQREPINFVVNGPLPAGERGIGLDLVLPQKGLSTPYSLQYGVTLEHTLGRDYLISVAYVGTKGKKLLRITTPEKGINQSLLSDGQNSVIQQMSGAAHFPVIFAFISAPQNTITKSILRIAPTFFEDSSSSNYNSLQLEVRKRYSTHFQFATALTYSHSNDDASDYLDTAGTPALPQNSLVRSERGPSGFDRRFRSVTNFVVDLPLKWQASGIFSLQTGQPFTVNSVFDINRDGNLTDRLNTTAGIVTNPLAGDPSIILGLAPGTEPASLLAPDGQDGAVGRNTFRASGSITFDVSFMRSFSLAAERKFQFRTEVFNLFNRTNFAIPDRILESPGFGKSVRTLTPARTIQFGLKIEF